MNHNFPYLTNNNKKQVAIKAEFNFWKFFLFRTEINLSLLFHQQNDQWYV